MPHFCKYLNKEPVMENIFINIYVMRIFSYFNNNNNKQLALDRILGLKLSLFDILDGAIINSVYKISLNLS